MPRMSYARTRVVTDTGSIEVKKMGNAYAVRLLLNCVRPGLFLPWVDVLERGIHHLRAESTANVRQSLVILMDAIDIRTSNVRWGRSPKWFRQLGKLELQQTFAFDENVDNLRQKARDEHKSAIQEKQELQKEQRRKDKTNRRLQMRALEQAIERHRASSIRFLLLAAKWARSAAKLVAIREVALKRGVYLSSPSVYSANTQD